MPDFRRRLNRLSAPSYSGRHIYFLTLCTSERRRLFENPKLATELIQLLHGTCREQCFEVYAYCFMPDHVHMILVGVNDNAVLAAVVRAFKDRATAAARQVGVSNLWQKGYYDRVLRSSESLDDAVAYLLMNPVRAGLVRGFAEWPHSGSSIMDWERLAPPDSAYVPPWKRVAG